MKQILVVAIALIASVSVHAQDNGTSAEWGYKPANPVENPKTEFTIDTFYQNKTELVIHTQVLEFPGKTKTEIMNGFKNWASTRFVNLKEVVVSETENQMVLNYITKQMYVKNLFTTTAEWYIRFIAEFKEGKMRVTYMDDGNTFWPGSQYAPSVSARSYKLTQYFKKDGQPYKGCMPGLINLKQSIISTTSSIKIDNQLVKNDNW